MNKNILLAALFITIVPFAFADPPGWEIEVINHNSICQGDALEISGSNVVWVGYEEIYFYNGDTGQTFQVTDNCSLTAMPQISGSNIIWQCDLIDDEIFFYKHQTQTTTRLTDNDYDDSSPRISGTNAAWQGFDGTDWEIFVYDGNDVTQLTDNDYDDYKPDISGTNVTWYADPNSDDFEIFFYNGTETIQLTDNAHDDELPRISGSNITWKGHDGNDNEIFLYSHETQITTQLTNNETNDNTPQISGSNVFWGKSLYDGDSITEIPFSYPIYSARLSGSKVVWYSYEVDPDNTEIYVYDHDKQEITKFTENNFNDLGPRISDEAVVWVGWNDPPEGPSSIDIMMAKYTGCIAPPEADTNNDCKIDATDLGNIANDWLTELNLPDFEVTRLTYNYNYDIGPKISGDNIVWFDGGDNTLRLYDSNAQSSIELGPGNYPVISGSNVAWSASDGSDYEIFFYDGTSVTQLTDNNYNDGYYYPTAHSTSLPISICGSRVVWDAEVNDLDWEIFLYEGDSIRQITDNEYYEGDPKISDSLITWVHFDGYDAEICIYDGHSVRQLTNNDSDDYSPQVSGSRIVWCGHGDNSNEIFLYNHDANSITQLTDNDYRDYYPVIGGEAAAWTGYDGNDWEIFYYDGSTIKQITDNDYDDGRVEYASTISISESGSKVVWMTYATSALEIEIYLYDAEKDLTIRLTDNNDIDWQPDISGNKVVWCGYLEDSDYYPEIFLATYSQCFNPPPEDANGDCKINLADFTILASEWLHCGMDDPALCW